MSLDAPAAGGAGLRFTCQYLSLATNIFNPNQDSVRVLRRVQHMTKILVGLSLRRDTLSAVLAPGLSATKKQLCFLGHPIDKNLLSTINKNAY
jgi:hypothetical protein